MTDLDRRVARLSPERRRLLDRLAAAATPKAPEEELDDDAWIDSDRFDFEGESLRDEEQIRRFYDAVSRQLDVTPFAEHAKFLNYGYVANDNPEHARVRPKPGEVNRNAIRLILELVGDTDIASNHEVLDVGCGRGGTASVLRSLFGPRRVIGLDLAGRAVAFCQRTQGGEDASFLLGNAEALPFAAASFDVVTNVESSHCYLHVEDFFSEVHRVLRGGGYFLYTDLIADGDIASREAFLANLGLAQERKQDITSNVLLSCDETAGAHARAFHGENDQALMDSFLGVPSTALYEAMKDGTQRYLMYRWRKGNSDEAVR